MTLANPIIFSGGIRIVDNEYDTETYPTEFVGRIVTPSDATTEEQMSIVEASGTLSFWEEPEENCYDESDGDAV